MKKLCLLCLLCLLSFNLTACGETSSPEEDFTNTVVCSTEVSDLDYIRMVTYNEEGTLEIYTERLTQNLDGDGYDNLIENNTLYVEGFYGYDGVTATIESSQGSTTTVITNVIVDLAEYDYTIDIVKLSSKIKKDAFADIESFIKYWENYSHECVQY